MAMRTAPSTLAHASTSELPCPKRTTVVRAVPWSKMCFMPAESHTHTHTASHAWQPCAHMHRGLGLLLEIEL